MRPTVVKLELASVVVLVIPNTVPLSSMAVLLQLMQVYAMLPVLAAAVLTHPLALLPSLAVQLLLQASHGVPALAVAKRLHAATSPFLAATSLLTLVNMQLA